MDTTPIARLDERRTAVELRPAVPFSLQDSEKIWVLLEGKLDLFLVEMSAGEATGTRHHLMNVDAGIALLPFDSMPSSALGVIAVPVIASQALCMDRAQFQRWAQSSPETVVPFIDRWIENLAVAANPEPAPTDYRRLMAGEEVATDENSVAGLPTAGPVWIRQIAGSSTPLGDGEMPPVTKGSFFPVTRAMWLHCAPQSRLVCFATPEWMESDAAWSGLGAFQEQIFARLVSLRRQEDEIEKARLHAVEEADASFFENALYNLAGPLRSGDEKFLETGPGTAEPLIQVCRVIFKATGIEVSRFPQAQNFARQPDPVNAIALACRIRSRQVMLKGKWWKLESVPMVGFYENRRPLALLPSRKGYQAYDPATGERTLVDEPFASKLHGFAYVFYRSFPHKKLNIADILSFGMRGSEKDAITIVLMGAAAGLLGMVAPVFTGIIFDTIIPGAQRGTLGEFSIFLVISALAMALFSLTRSLATLRLESRMEASVQAAVWDRLLGLPVPFFRQFTSGDLARRSLGIGKIREILTGSALTSILTGIFSVTSCALMFYYSWQLALVAAALVLVSLLVSTLCGLFEVRILRNVSELSGRIAGMTLQFINGIPKFRVAGTEARAFGVWAEQFSKQRILSLRAGKISNILEVFDSAFPVVAWSVLFYCSAVLLKTPGQGLTTGEFLAFLAAFVQFSTGALDLSSQMISVLNVVPLYERAKPILAALPEVSSTQKEPRPLVGGIDLHHVSFRYRDEGPLVLRDISLTVTPGQFLAVVGPSGSGKSTLFRLLLGFETPSAGAIYYDGQDLAELDIQSIRRQIGVVLQNAKLMQGSVFRNIVGEGTLTIDDAWEAARSAGLEEDLKQMPMGMHTVISESGGGLSGGQRQRLLVARAIVRKPRILLFDEATSALDNRTQAIVSQSLKDLNATRIIIAHRLSTVMHADRIHVIDKGILVESGTYDELMAQNGLFTQLAKRQLS